jgi:hypothetical protein
VWVSGCVVPPYSEILLLISYAPRTETVYRARVFDQTNTPRWLAAVHETDSAAGLVTNHESETVEPYYYNNLPRRPHAIRSPSHCSNKRFPFARRNPPPPLMDLGRTKSAAAVSVTSQVNKVPSCTSGLLFSALATPWLREPWVNASK